MSYVLKIMLRICLCKQTNICTYECLVACQSEKKYIWNWSKILCIFHFFINFFIMKTLIKSKIYCHAVSLNHLFMYVVKIVCQASLPLFLTWVSLAIFYLIQCHMELPVQLSIIVIGRRDNSIPLVHVEWWKLLSYI